MINEINMYCDESCHIENDHQKTMVLGSIWASVESSKFASIRIKEIKAKHGIAPSQEIKWTKISPNNTFLYLDLIDYFFDNADIHFRGLVVPDKTILDHKSYGQTHNDWYYKMYFLLLTAVLAKENKYNIYMDIKDTLGGKRIAKLHEVLASAKYDFERNVVNRTQLIRSHEVQLIQLADVLIGALMYKHRGVYASEAKKAIVERIEKRSGFTLMRNTLLTEDKFNIFIWKQEQIES